MLTQKIIQTRSWSSYWLTEAIKYQKLNTLTHIHITEIQTHPEIGKSYKLIWRKFNFEWKFTAMALCFAMFFFFFFAYSVLVCEVKHAHILQQSVAGLISFSHISFHFHLHHSRSAFLILILSSVFPSIFITLTIFLFYLSNKMIFHHILRTNIH